MAQTEKQLANLRPITSLSKEEAKRRGKMGAEKSAQVRRQRKAMRETLLELLQLPAEKRPEMSNEQAGLIAMLERWHKGDVSAGVFIRDTIGEKPVEKRDVAMQAEVALTNEQRAAVYRLALQAAMRGDGEDDLK